MEPEIYQKIIRWFKPNDFKVILMDSLSPKEIISLAKEAGISYEGVRITSVPEETIVGDLVEEFFSQRQIAQTIVETLSLKNTKLTHKLSSMTPPQIKKYIENTEEFFDGKEIGQILWALIIDQRPEANKLIPKFLKAFKKSLSESFWGTISRRLKDSEGLEDELEELHSNKENLTQQLKKTQRHERKLLEKFNSLNQKLFNLQRDNDNLVKERNDLKKQLTLLQREENVLKGKASQLQFFEEREKQLHLRIAELEKENKVLKEKIKEREGQSLPRVGIFVDAQNIHCGAKEKYNCRINYQLLLSKLVGTRRLSKALAYVVKSNDNPQTALISALERIGYEVKTRGIQVRPDGSTKGDWDIGLTIDALSYVNNLDTMVLVSGDGDFVDLVKKFKSHGVRVEIAAFPHNTSQELLLIADQYYPLGEEVLYI